MELKKRRKIFIDSDFLRVVRPAGFGVLERTRGSQQEANGNGNRYLCATLSPACAGCRSQFLQIIIGGLFSTMISNNYTKDDGTHKMQKTSFSPRCNAPWILRPARGTFAICSGVIVVRACGQGFWPERNSLLADCC